MINKTIMQPIRTPGEQVHQEIEFNRPVDDKAKSCWSKMTQWLTENKSSLLLSGISVVALGATGGLAMASVISGVLAYKLAIVAVLFFAAGVCGMVERASAKKELVKGEKDWQSISSELDKFERSLPTNEDITNASLEKLVSLVEDWIRNEGDLIERLKRLNSSGIYALELNIDFTRGNLEQIKDLLKASKQKVIDPIDINDYEYYVGRINAQLEITKEVVQRVKKDDLGVFQWRDDRLKKIIK